MIQGTSEDDKSWAARAQEDFRAYESTLEFTQLNGLSPAEMQKALSGLPQNTIVFFVSSIRDNRGNTYESPDYLRQVTPGSTAPIYGTTEAHLGAGIVGGKLLSFEALGIEGGKVGLRVLAGEKPETISPHAVPGVIMFDWRELQRWRISEQSLPPGSIVRFKQPTFWELYKWYAIGLIAAVIIEALLIAWLLLLRVRRRQAEEENLRLALLAEDERKRLDEVVSNVPGLVWETRLEPGSDVRKTTFVSDYIEKMLGYTAEEWLAQPQSFGFQLMPDEEDRQNAARVTEAVMKSGQDGIVQYRCVTKDGRTVWLEAYLSALANGDGKVVGLRGVTLDVTKRKQAEETAAQAEERDRAILSAIPDLIFLQTRDGVYLDYHTMDSEDLLLPPNEYLGKNMSEVLPPELAAQFAVCFERVEESGEPQILEYQLAINKVPRWFEARMVSSGENILSVVRDITERHRALNELRESEERFGKAFRANPQPMSLTVLANARYVDVNESFLQVSGYTRDEVIGKTALELKIWETPAAREVFVGNIKDRGSVQNVETRLRAKDGSIHVLLSSAEQLEIGGEQCLLIASSDITARVKAQEALRESEERFRNMAETAPVMIWVTDDQQQTTYLNKQFLDLTGRSLQQELGFGWSADVHPDDLDATVETYTNAFKQHIPFELECRLRRGDGEYRWILASAAPRFSPTEEFLGYIGSCIDITERKESEQEIRQAHEQLVVAHKEVNRLKNQLQEENIYLREEIKLEQNFDEIVGSSDALKYVLFKIEQVAPTDSTVLITGETGTGKELVARAIHGASSRKDRPLVKVNCGALSAGLIESELFGHEKGAFTGAAGRKIGRFELANRATIFLDEIGELPPDLQVKLLRVIQEGEFERLGSSQTNKIDVRIIAATNRNLDLEVKKGLFREDLWYRLNVFPITVPPLRQRREDIAVLVEHFTRRFNKKFGKQVTSISPATLKSLGDYSWPGNVRELANVIERALINSHGSVLKIAEEFEVAAVEQLSTSTKTLEEIERDYIVHVLEDRGWRIEGRHGAARLLGLNPSTLRTRMLKLGIQKPQSFSTSAS
jgi:PAS domain S-box-containing protein